MTAAMIGLVLANSPFGKPLLAALAFKLDIELLGIQITVGHVVSDLFLALFFFVAGLELKYELKIGTLSSPKKAMVPVLAALAGVAVPSLIYAYLNWGTVGIVGWPIPSATDIAFALGVLAIFGRGMPTAARIFLLALAVFDDLIAISIIAIFYTTKLEPAWLIASFLVAGAFRFAEKSRFPNKWLIRASFGLILWYTIYQSGVHATVAGVLLGILIPAVRTNAAMSKVQPATNFFVLPTKRQTSPHNSGFCPTWLASGNWIHSIAIDCPLGFHRRPGTLCAGDSWSTAWFLCSNGSWWYRTLV